MTKRTAILLLICSLAANLAVADVWQDLTKYKYGDPGDLPKQAEDLLHATPVKEHAAIEAALIKVIEAEDGTSDGKGFACRMLQQVGTEKAIPALSALLTDEILSHYARLVLESMDSDDAVEAMRDAVKDAPDKVKIGLMGSLGAKRDERFVKEASKLTGHKDPAVASAAIECLGRIGGGDAAKFLMKKVRPAEGLEVVHMRAVIECGSTVRESVAIYLYEKVLASQDAPTPCRVAALVGMCRVDAEKGAALVVNAIREDDVRMRAGALTLVAGEPGAELTSAAADLLADLEGAEKAAVIVALGARGDASALKSIIGQLGDKDAAVRDAAIAAIGKLGDAGSVEMLLSAAADPAIAGKIADTIARMGDAEVNAALIKALANAEVRVQAVKVLAARNHKAAVPGLLELVGDKEPAARQAAWSALSTLAGDEHLAGMVDAAVKTPEDLAHNAIRNVVAASADKNKSFSTVASRYDKAPDKTKLFILELGATVASPQALELAETALKSGDKARRTAATRALATWKNETAAPYLLALAKDGPGEVDKVLALRGYIRIAGMREARLDPRKRVEMLSTAAGLAGRDDERRSIIATAKGIRNAESLAVIDSLLVVDSVRKEAELAALDLGKHMASHAPEKVKAIAEKLLQSKDKGIADKAKQLIAECEKHMK